MTSDPVTSINEERKSTRVGAWLSRYRIWGLIPLIALGLCLHIGELPIRSGLMMMIAGGMGILSGTLLRIICRTFTNPSGVSQPLESMLITDGPFAITRNPVFLSEAAIALGIAMMSRMPWLIVVTLLAAVLMYAPIIEWQENQLRQSNPEGFAKYARLVPRWFSPRNFFDRDSYYKSRSQVSVLRAVRSESLTMLIGLVAILAFLAKANLEAYL